MGLKAQDVKYLIDRIGSVMAEKKEYLTELDSAIGDADHGINMNKGFKAVAKKLEGLDTEDIGSILKAVGMALVTNVGGASGPLYGTAFMKAGASVTGKTEVNIEDLDTMMAAAIGGIKMRGKAEVGDKTMIDALEPALKSLEESVNEGMDPINALERAVESARAGVLYTKGIQARKGRASYLGERSIGHQDPGATSSYLMINSIYETVKEIKARG